MSSFCLGCGNSMSEGERFCGICGRDSSAESTAPRVDPAMAFGLPPETSGKAIFSLVCGILFLILPLSFAAVIFGYVSLSEIRRSGGRLTGRGLAITGIILGYVGVALILGLFGLGFYENHKQSVARKQATKRPVITAANNENTVVGAVRTLNTAEIAYAAAHHDSGYTCSLSQLSGAWGIGADLARGRKNGYIFELQNCTALKKDGPIAKYKLVAYSATPGKTATPVFCSDESDVIRVVRNGSAEDCLKNGTDLSEREITHPQNYSQTSR